MVCISFFGYDQLLLRYVPLYVDVGRRMFWCRYLGLPAFLSEFCLLRNFLFYSKRLGFLFRNSLYEWCPSIYLTLECFKRGQMEAWFMLPWEFPYLNLRDLDYLWKIVYIRGAQSLTDLKNLIFSLPRPIFAKTSIIYLIFSTKLYLSKHYVAVIRVKGVTFRG